MNTPVVFIVFNRVDVAARVLSEIRRARPPALFIVADGPRPDREGEAEKCAAVRRLVETGIDWPCDVRSNYSDTNLGCARRVSSGLDWVFAQVEQAIILEDDCLPDPTFFPFCEELLERYRDDERVAQVSGYTFTNAELRRETSYVFGRSGSIWGWATWRRAWVHHNRFLSRWSELRGSPLWHRMMPWKPERRARERAYENILAGRLDSWAFPWGMIKVDRQMLSVVPCVNLVENIGFGADATHTTGHNLSWPRGRMPLPLRHPPVLADADYDRAYSRHFAPGWWRGNIRRLRRLFRI